MIYHLKVICLSVSVLAALSGLHAITGHSTGDDQLSRETIPALVASKIDMREAQTSTLVSTSLRSLAVY